MIVMPFRQFVARPVISCVSASFIPEDDIFRPVCKTNIYILYYKIPIRGKGARLHGLDICVLYGTKQAVLAEVTVEPFGMAII